jgi:hypothetical protein
MTLRGMAITIAVIAVIAIAENKMIATQQNSHQDNSEIQSLNSDIHDLGDKVGFWTTWNIVFVAAVVLIAAGVFFTQWMLNNRSKLLSEKQSALVQAKDRQLASDLQDKELKISQANERETFA